MNKIDIEMFVRGVDNSFPIPLSRKQDLKQFAHKLYEHATLCAEYEDEKIVSLVAGYTENVLENRAYISVAATCAEARGKGYASKLIKEFIDICRQKDLDAVHLYAVPSNVTAVNMYKRLGFEEWVIENETRPNDLHLIYYIKK